MILVRGVLYKAKETLYDKDEPEYNCFEAYDSGDRRSGVTRVYVTTEAGVRYPGMTEPISVNVSNLGEVIHRENS